MKHRSDTSVSLKETIRGVVVPAQWDDQFRVTDILIACLGEREVRVGNLESFPVLRTLERTEVRLTGTVKRDGGVEVIHVESVAPLGQESAHQP
ncbi:hypothetical protein [Pseudodesulfovibrio sp.]|uniref:hypothetical protein n=1 Tax=Pseudodesulfovibrio sp. TaxID=2035812 RepID=UPI0026181ACE|nr:hypothetical protein [Pseudodesulfovibrio sp.]MDD3310590.1 hypothetical protein [Pseudodesulfovibrio sp.]